MRLRDFVPIHRGHVLNLDNKRSTDANYLCKLSLAINKYVKKNCANLCHRNKDIVNIYVYTDEVSHLIYRYQDIMFQYNFHIISADIVLLCLIYSDEAYERGLASRYHFLPLLSIVSICELRYIPYRI